MARSCKFDDEFLLSERNKQELVTGSTSEDSDSKISQQNSNKQTNTLIENSKSRFERSAPQRRSKVLATHPRYDDAAHATSQIRYQPSKVFAQKCLTELQSILDSIKVDYHEEIKKLYISEDSQLYSDLCIIIGHDFKKLVHKCIIASRAYKFYSALKLFRKPADDHIIIREFETHKNNREDKEENDQLSPEELIAKKLRERQLKEALESLECIIPDDLINQYSIESFLRRSYFNQDLEEETHLSKKLIDWLKLNRPEAISVNASRTKISQPDHRESFRTVQPNFDQAACESDRTESSVNNDNLSTTTIDSVIDTSSDLKMDQYQSSIEETSQTTSLTRTETFDLITKGENSPLTGSPAPTGASSNRSVTDNLTDDDESRKQTANDSESSEPYAPTTRTGLKPKKFTTPVGMRSTPKSKSTAITNLGDSASVGPALSIVKGGPTSSEGGAVKPAARKLSSGQDHKPAASTAASSTPKTSTPLVKNAKAQKVITRAHPISLERSQSPATNTTTRATKQKNFIAANKKLVSQMEKKIAAISISGTNSSTLSQSNNPLDVSQLASGSVSTEIENTDMSFLAVEPLTMDNLAGQLDKFTLASCSKLAEALSRMFLGEILSDTIVLVNNGNRQIKAHKCILAARSAYLNDVINKQIASDLALESVSSVKLEPLKIDLGEFTYPSVYFSFMHIYSGIVKVPEDLDLEELAKLSHLLHVGTLRQVCIHNLRMNYCHYFHKPCSTCCIGMLKTLPLAWRYDYTELYSKCLQWIGSNFAQIFCLEEFSNLKPHDLIEECYKATLDQLTPDNIIQKTVECQKLLKSLPRVKWTESIICLVGRQLEDFCHYVADNYEKILKSESFLALGKTCWECEVLEENLLAAMNHLKPESGCKILIQLDKIECLIESYSGGFEGDDSPLSSKNVSESFTSLVAKMRKYCERYLLKEAASVVHCPSWRLMQPSLQKRIKDQALLSTDFDEPTKTLAAKPKLPSMIRQQAGSRLSPSSPKSRSPSGAISPINLTSKDSPSRLKSPNVTYLPPPKSKPAAARHVKVLK